MFFESENSFDHRGYTRGAFRVTEVGLGLLI
jgi:hypothetical protein